MKKWLVLLLMICLLSISAGAQAEIIYPEKPVMNSKEEFIEYVLQKTASGASSISVYYPEEVSRIVSNDEELFSFLSGCGVKDWKGKTTFYFGKRLLEIEGLVYYTGAKIARAWEKDRVHILKEEERLTLEKALSIVEKAKEKCSTPLELERYLHDELCRIVKYQSGETEESPENTAVGAILYGGAECDGYADAFYLLGRLAGLNVGYFLGETISERPESAGMHLWNVIEWDGLWYHVDVCWDDLDYDDYTMIRYTYFNVSEDLMSDHVWSKEAVVYPLATKTNMDKFFYTCGQSGEKGFGGYYSSVKSAAKYIEQCWRKGQTCAYVMVDGTYTGHQKLTDAMFETSISDSWKMWMRNVGDYTLFDILFVD